MKGKLVGSGSYGSVHLAMSKATGALFVVKSAQSRDGVEALEKEVKILESLNSPYVVKCMGRENGEGKCINVFMEYMAGGSLSDVSQIFGGALEEEVVRLYTREIIHGLEYLHESGIVHCDLKGKNVLLGSSGNVKLADFGFAKRLKDSKVDGASVQHSLQCMGGTPLWMAPEVLRDEELDFASDIWSLGCTVIEMATGRPPWGNEIWNPVAAVLKILVATRSLSSRKSSRTKDWISYQGAWKETPKGGGLLRSCSTIHLCPETQCEFQERARPTHPQAHKTVDFTKRLLIVQMRD